MDYLISQNKKKLFLDKCWILIRKQRMSENKNENNAQL